MNTKTLIEKLKSDELLNTIKDHAKDFPSADIYAVGGLIRDFILDKKNFDKDIIVDKSCAQEFAQSLCKKLDGTFIALDEKNKIYRIVLRDKINFIDAANTIGKNIKEDLKRRDLTINSIAFNIKTEEILDLSQGLNDLKTQKIRQISEFNTLDDPLRILRAFRFQAQLGFEIDNDFLNTIKNNAKQIHKPAIERINYEFLKLMDGKFASKTLLKMDECGVLEELIPFVKDLKKVPPNSHHHLDLFHHSIETVKQIELLFENSPQEVKTHLKSSDFGGNSRLAHLKLAGLLHDIGKFETWTIENVEGKEKHRFIKHDDVGAKFASKFLKKHKFSKKQTDYITKMIKYHIYPSHVVSSPDLSDKIFMRFIRKMESDVIDIIFLAKADRYSARGVEITTKIVNNNIIGLDKLLKFYLDIKESLKPLPKLLSGNEVMELLDLKPSKELGIILHLLKEEQFSGNITTKQEAIAFVKSQVH